MAISRRQFTQLLMTLGITPLLGIEASVAKDNTALTVAALGVTVPRYLLLSKGKNRLATLWLSLQEDKVSRRVVTDFAGGQTRILETNTTVSSLMLVNKNRATRESMLLKRLLGYALEAIFRGIWGKRLLAESTNIRRRFDVFQTEEVVDELCLEAVADLVNQLNRVAAVSAVIWNPGEKRFVVNG